MHPVLFQIPGIDLPIFSYGAMLGLSLFVAWYLIMYLGTKKEHLSRELMANCFIVTAICSIIGARLLYVATNQDEYGDVAKWFDIRGGGMVAYGGFLGGFFASWAYLRLKKVPLLAWADVVAPTLGSGLFFTRIGCYLYGCDFGARLDEGAPAWLKGLGTFPHWDYGAEGPSGSPAWSYHVMNYDLPATAEASFPVHPTQLYESIAGVVLFGVCMAVWQRRKFRGQVLFVLVILYGAWRFFIETVRDDPERGAAFGFSTSQLISMVLVPLAAVAWVVVQKRVKEHGEVPIPKSALEGASADKKPPAEGGSTPKGGSVKKRKKGTRR